MTLRQGILVSLAALLCGTPPVGAAEKAIWGPTELPDGQSAFPLYAELGLDTFQYGLNWNTVASTRPASPRNPGDEAYRWPPELDAILTGAATHGIKVALLVAYTPPWANGGQPQVWAPTDPADIADFIVRREQALSGRAGAGWSGGSRTGWTGFQPNEAEPADRPARLRHGCSTTPTPH